MTNEQRQKSRRLVLLSIAVVTLLLPISISAVGPHLLEQATVIYGEPSYAPERSEYCPGETLRAQYVLERRDLGPVEIVGSWCTPENSCILGLTTVQHGQIFIERPPSAATLSLTIPPSPAFKPGTSWFYVRSVRRLGRDSFSMFVVPFKIAQNCK